MLTHSSGGQLFKSFLDKLHGWAGWFVGMVTHRVHPLACRVSAL